MAGAFMGAFVLFIWIFNGGGFYGIQKNRSNSNYKYINPLIAVEREQITDFFSNDLLKTKLTKIIDNHKKNHDIQEAAIYFRDLDYGRWVGINEDLKFSPGKLIKVPIMIAYFKQAESDPKILQKQLKYIADPQSNGGNNLAGLQNGEMYTVEKLIETMIIDDNDNSANLLFDSMNRESLNEVFSDLGINFQEDKKTEDYITVKQYGLFFRILYNATYLSTTFSERALDILSQTPDFTGISVGLPNDLVIASKYRARSFVQNGKKLKENHECGIIYYPKHPYLTCVMGIGPNSTAIDDTFKELSRAVYNNMSETYKN
jgi:beta-lactamase class A